MTIPDLMFGYVVALLTLQLLLVLLCMLFVVGMFVVDVIRG